jgi:hypothetical protein
MHKAEESMAVAAEVPQDLPEKGHAPPPEVPAPPDEAPPPPPNALHTVAHDRRAGELPSRESAVGLQYRQRRRM